MLSKIVKPVQLLYHGTALDYSKLIEQQGLKPVNHDKVYLTADLNVAYEYAKKRTRDLHTNSVQPVICIVDAEQMYKDGYTFTHEVNNAEYTVDYVPSKYLLQVMPESEDDLELLAHYAQEQVCYS